MAYLRSLTRQICRLYNSVDSKRRVKLFGGLTPHMKCLVRASIAVFAAFVSTAFADIAIVKTAGTSLFDEVRNGFASICFENQREFPLQQDLSNQSEVADQIRAGNYKLLVSIGSEATTFARTTLPQTNLVYAMVTFPERLGLKGDNVAGIPLPVPFEQQFALIRSINKKFKRIGALYTRPFNEPLIQSARTFAESHGMTLVSFPIASSFELEKAMNNMTGKCDVLWVPPDPILDSDELIRYVGATSISRQIPCVGSNERFVKAGAIFCLTVDAVEIGRLAGELVNQALQGKPFSTLKVAETSKPRFILNVRAANSLKLPIPKEIQNKANKLYQ